MLRPKLVVSTKAARPYLLRSAVCVTNESLQDATPLSGNFGNEKFFFFRFHCVLVDKGEISRCKLRSQWPKEN